uniref:Transmembrane protein 170B n=1 Tax=Hippocampus comes TaxID=109280 RepID=A0A3Q2Y0B0_HIPCM
MQKNCTLGLNSGTLIITVANANLNLNGHLRVFLGLVVHPGYYPPPPSEMWYWVFLWCLFSSLFVHGVVGLLMFIMLQRHKRGRLITVVLVSVGFLASLSGGVITSAAIAGVYRVAGKDMAPLEALLLGVGQTSLSVIISFSRILATL